MATTRAVTSSSDIPPLALLAVSTRFMIPDSINSGVLSMMQRRADFVRDDIVGGWLVFPDFYVAASGVDTVPGAPRTISASLEYPAGTMNRAFFSGMPTGTTTAGQARFISDYMTINIPANSQIWFNTRQASAAGIIYSSTFGAFSALGDQQNIGTNVADHTMTAGWSGTPGGNPYGPLFVAMTRNGAVVIVGDSRSQGVGNTTNSVAHSGDIAPAIAPYMGVINLARGSVTAQATATGDNGSKRAEYFQYATAAINELGANDIAAGRTAAQLRADRETIRLMAPTLKWFGTTLGPKTTSSDAWATTTNQTTDGTNGVRVGFNDLERAGAPGFAGVIEMADRYESARNSGVYKAPPQVPAAITADGNHLNNAGYALAYGAVNIGLFGR